MGKRGRKRKIDQIFKSDEIEKDDKKWKPPSKKNIKIGEVYDPLKSQKKKTILKTKIRKIEKKEPKHKKIRVKPILKKPESQQYFPKILTVKKDSPVIVKQLNKEIENKLKTNIMLEENDRLGNVSSNRILPGMKDKENLKKIAANQYY